MHTAVSFAVCYVAALILPFLAARYALAPPAVGTTYRRPVLRFFSFLALGFAPVWLSEFVAPILFGQVLGEPVHTLLQVSTCLLSLVSLLIGYFRPFRRA